MPQWHNNNNWLNHRHSNMPGTNRSGLCLCILVWQPGKGANMIIFPRHLAALTYSKLNTDQWCSVAKSWGAKQIIFVSKHVGGFCWWPTGTNDYSVQHTPWRNGKGDLFKELSASCKKYRLKMGVYIYRGDDKWGAGLGSGGAPVIHQSRKNIIRFIVNS